MVTPHHNDISHLTPVRGNDVAHLAEMPFDIVIATDTMYIPEEAKTLLETIKQISHEKSIIYLSYGRNK